VILNFLDSNPFLPAGLDGGLEDVRVVKVLHGLGREIDAQLLESTLPQFLESKHVQDPNESVSGMPDGHAECRH